MAAYIKTLQDASHANIIYPRTKAVAVFRDDENTTPVEDTLVTLETQMEGALRDINNINSNINTTNANFSSHAEDSNIHITSAERIAWNSLDSKANGYVNTHNVDTTAHEDIRSELINAKSSTIEYINTQINTHTHSWNDLDDKPFGETESWTLITSLEFEGTYANLNLLDTSVKNIKFVFDGEEYFFDFYGDGTYGGDGYPFEFSAEFSGFAIGYVLYITCDDGFHTVEIYEGKTTVKTIDAKYLPDSVKAQPDWHQNDESAPDYVKNRFGGYYENVYSTVFEETTLEFEPYASGNGYYTSIDDYNVAEKLFGSKPTVKVTFDGVVYEKAFEKYSGFDSDETIPFGFYVQIADGAHLQIDTTLEGDTHTVKIEKVEKLPVTISEEFLPDSVKAQPDWNQNDETALDFVKNRPFGYYDIQWTLGEGVVNDEWGQKVENVVINDFAIQEDGMYKATTTNLGYTFYSWKDVYKIVIDGISYIGKGSHEEFDTGGDTGSVIISSSFICEQPFIKIYNHRNGFQITTELSGDTHTLSIYVGTSIPKKVPDDFLPESALVTSLDWEQRDPKALDYIKNKPYGYFTRNRYFKEIPHFRLPKGTLIVKSRAIEIEEGLPYYGLNKVFFLNNKFIGVGMDLSYASIVFSDDGLNWYNKTDLPSAMFKYSTHSQLLIYGNNTYLTAQKYETALASSTDEGASWTVIDSPATDYIKSLFFANNKFFVATETELYASENLINWELIYTKEEEEEGIIQQATYIKNKILIIFNKKIISLTDGENDWKEIDLPVYAGWLGPVLLDNENRLFLFSDFDNTSVYSDDNGDTWDYLTDFDFFDRGSFSSYESCRDYTSDGNSLVFVTNGNIWKTNDGHDFEYGYADLGEIPTLEWITYGNGIFLAGFENGVIYSEDGTTWITSPEVVITTPDSYFTPNKLANYLVSQEMVSDMIEEAIGAAIGGSY